MTETEGETIVLVGASNWTRGLGVLRGIFGRTAGGPVSVLAAIGMGRSYGLTSSVLGRSLPAVLDCGLWPALDARPPGFLAFVADVGNDLLYGQDVPTILAWVDECARRLQTRGARLVMTSLPPTVAEVSYLRFLLFRSLLFPRSTLRFDSLPQALADLNAGLRRIAAARSAAFVPLRREWYGFDPIHMRLRDQRAAFAEIVSAAETVPPFPPATLARSLRTYALLAERQWLFGREIRRAQPCLRDPDGSTVSLY
jgi:hypothetical protein